MKSLRKISEVLDCFTKVEPRISLNIISEKTGFPKSTVHRLLKSLKDIGFIIQDSSRDLYRLGDRILNLSGIVLSDLDLPRHSRSPAIRLMNQSGEAVHVCVFDGQNVISVDRHDMGKNTNEIVKIESEPPYCTGTGKAILACLSDKHVRDLIGQNLEKYTTKTITDLGQMIEELDLIRSRGFAIDNEERQYGIKCVSVAIYHKSKVIGAISVTGAKERFSESRIIILADLVKDAAYFISQSLETGIIPKWIRSH
jgi:DNA-binding IclR family transcriptional regulator